MKKDLPIIILLVLLMLMVLSNRYFPVPQKLDNSKIDSLFNQNKLIDHKISAIINNIDSLEGNISNARDSIIIIREYYDKKNKSIDTASVGTLYRYWSKHTR